MVQYNWLLTFNVINLRRWRSTSYVFNVFNVNVLISIVMMIN